jgi:hypothetical protein
MGVGYVEEKWVGIYERVYWGFVDKVELKLKRLL